MSDQLDVRPVDIHQPQQIEAFGQLLNNAFGEPFPADLLNHILHQSHPQTAMLGAYDRGNLVAMNAFIAHPVQQNGKTGIAYQSCLTATHKDYKGRGLFSTIINTAKEVLAAQGGAFIFGYPNSNSGPIFVNKLGFDLVDCATVYFPTAKWLRLLGAKRVSSDKLSQTLYETEEQAVRFDARSTAHWKKTKQNCPTVIDAEFYTNYVFGRVRQRKLGPANIRIFAVGGYEINKPEIFEDLITKASRQAGCHVARVIAPANSPIIRACSGAKTTEKTEPLIVYPLNWPVDINAVDAWQGLKDVY